MISNSFGVDTIYVHVNKSATPIADIRNVLKTKAHMGLASSVGFIKLTAGVKASETSKHAAVLQEQSCLFLLLLCLQSWDSPSCSTEPHQNVRAFTGTRTVQIASTSVVDFKL